MASEGPAAGQTTVEQIEEKKVVEEAPTVGEVGASQPEGTAESEGAEKPNVKELASSETVLIDSKETTEDKEDEEPAAKAGKKEDEAGEDTASRVLLEGEKPVEPAIDGVEKENEETKASNGGVVGNENNETSAAEVVNETVETGKTSNTDESEIENSVKEPKENSAVTAESLSEAVQNQVVEDSEPSLVHEPDQVRREPGVAEPVAEVTETTGEPLDSSDSRIVPSESTALSMEHPIVPAVTESTPEAPEKHEDRNEVLEDNEAVEASEDKNASTVDVEAGNELTKEESDVKETGRYSSTLQALEVGPGDAAVVVGAKAIGSRDAFPVNAEKAENNKDGEDANENLVKEGNAADTGTVVQTTSTTDSEVETTDAVLVSEVSGSPMEPQANVEEQKEEQIPVAERVENGKEVETTEEEPLKEQREEKAEATEATKEDRPSEAMDNPSFPPAEIIENATTEDKFSEYGEKVVEEQTDSNSAVKAAEVSLQEEKPPQVAEKIAEELKDEEVKDATSVTQISRDMGVEDETTKADISVKEAVDTGDVEKAETERKQEETEKTDAKNSAESSKDDVEVQKSEAPVKPKSIMSKVKHSIVKVKKAIIGKSPSSKTMSSRELKDLT